MNGERISKDESLYGFPPPMGEVGSCERCVFYQPVVLGKNGEFPEAGTCSRVYGIVEAVKGCMDWDAAEIPEEVGKRTKILE